LNNSNVGDFSQREFPMTQQNFEEIKVVAYSLTGISLSNHKKNMVYGRLARRLRRLNVASFNEYCDVIREKNSREHVEFVNAITTNLTSFFREGHHFEFLSTKLLPRLLAEKRQEKRIRIWSAGCSTGEEPYSIAMTLKNFTGMSTWDVKILATDLDSNVVEKARLGEYATERVETIPDNCRRFIARNNVEDRVRVKDVIRDMITFKQLNLLHEWPMKGRFDIIFCRNVVIYFDVETQKKLFERYANLLETTGNLFIGHSENLHNITSRFKSLGRTIYELN